jgi:hypothetical protein
MTVGSNWSNKTVTPARDGLNKPRAAGCISKGIPQLINSCIQAFVEIDKGIRWPDLRAKFFTGDDFPRAL